MTAGVARRVLLFTALFFVGAGCRTVEESGPPPEFWDKVHWNFASFLKERISVEELGTHVGHGPYRPPEALAHRILGERKGFQAGMWRFRGGSEVLVMYDLPTSKAFEWVMVLPSGVVRERRVADDYFRYQSDVVKGMHRDEVLALLGPPLARGLEDPYVAGLANMVEDNDENGQAAREVEDVLAYAPVGWTEVDHYFPIERGSGQVLGAGIVMLSGRIAVRGGVVPAPTPEEVHKKLCDPMPFERCEMLTLIAMAEARQYLPAVREALGDEFPGVAAHAAWALGELGDKSAAPHLERFLKQADRDGKMQAALALSWIGDPSSSSALKEALQDPRAGRHAGIALWSLDASQGIKVLCDALSDAKTRLNAAFALAYIADATSVPSLLDALPESDEQSRWAISYALGAIGDARAVPVLTGLLQDDSSVLVKRSAAMALGRIGSEEAVRQLVEAVASSELAWCAVYSLGLIGNEECQRALESVTKDTGTRAHVRHTADRGLACMLERQVPAVPVVPASVHEERAEE